MGVTDTEETEYVEVSRLEDRLGRFSDAAHTIDVFDHVSDQ